MSGHWIGQALSLGFDEAASLDPQSLTVHREVREACAENRCHAYGRSWSCPPHCGSLADCEERMRSYEKGLLLQTVGKLSKTIDTRGYAAAEKRHWDNLRRLAERIRAEYPDALCLGAGVCPLCASCAWPEPCRCPAQTFHSMEAYGLFVTEVCRSAGLDYHHGEKTVTYSACVLFDRR